MKSVKLSVVCMLFAAFFGVMAFGGEADMEKPAGRGARLEHRTALDLEYPVTGQAKVDRVIQEWLEERVNGVMKSYVGVALDPDYTESVDTISVTYREVRPSARVVSYEFVTYAYPWRAAHPMSYVDVLNIDLDKRSRLGLGDVFAYPDRALRLFSEKAPGAVRRYFMEKSPEMFEGVDSGDVFFMEGFEAREENFGVFCLEEGGIRLIFQPYQVLPYVAGRPEAFIPLGELAEAGPRVGLWGK